MSQISVIWHAESLIDFSRDDLGVFHDAEIYSLHIDFVDPISILLDLEVGDFLDGDTSFLGLKGDQDRCLIRFLACSDFTLKGFEYKTKTDSVEVLRVETNFEKLQIGERANECFIRLNSGSEIKFSFHQAFVLH
jgi:hypothetical protein